MLCWGYNGFGQLGDNSGEDKRRPAGVIGLSSGVTGIAAGMRHTCALTAGGGVKCWGHNEWGELGNNSTTDSPLLADVSNLSSGAAAIAAGDYHLRLGAERIQVTVCLPCGPRSPLLRSSVLSQLTAESVCMQRLRITTQSEPAQIAGAIAKYARCDDQAELTAITTEAKARA